MRTIRLFHILDLMRGLSRPISANVLAEKLDVSPRTIYRDMTTLLSMGAPIRGEAGIGYQLESGFFLPPLHFDEDELDTLVLGLRMLNVRSDKSTQEIVHRVLGKLDVVSREDTKGRLIERPLLAVGKENEALDYIGEIRRAIRNRFLLNIEYLDLNEQTTRRTIRPLGLTAFESVWLVSAWCEERDDFRDFRVDRIQFLTNLNQTFRHENGKRFTDYLRRYQ